MPAGIKRMEAFYEKKQIVSNGNTGIGAGIRFRGGGVRV
jgi:hypothetical protein